MNKKKYQTAGNELREICWSAVSVFSNLHFLLAERDHEVSGQTAGCDSPPSSPPDRSLTLAEPKELQEDVNI